MAPSSGPYARQVPSHAWDARTTDRIAAPQGCWRKIRPIEALKNLQLRVHRSPDPPGCRLSEVEWLLTTPAAAYSAWRSNNRKVERRNK
jgi:hypothetical protein